MTDTSAQIQKTDPAEASSKAATLVESLPWLRRFRDQIVVIKYGGNAMISDELQDAFAEDIAYLRYVGVQPVVVHGGGPQISSMLERLDIPSEFKGGYRVTSTEAISVVRMVLTGQINPQLVAKINSHGPMATGLSGEDAGLFGGRRRGVIIDGAEVDLGRVGDVVEVDPTPVLDHLAAGRVPVVSSIAPDLTRVNRSTSMPMLPRPHWRSHSVRPSWSCSPMCRGSTATGQTVIRSSRTSPRLSCERCCRAWSRE